MITVDVELRKEPQLKDIEGFGFFIHDNKLWIRFSVHPDEPLVSCYCFDNKTNENFCCDNYVKYAEVDEIKAREV